MTTLNSNPHGTSAGGNASVGRASPVAPATVVVAHPGHELLAFGWLTRLEPLVYVVTDGSGRDARPRIEATRKLLNGGLGVAGSIFGRWSDRELYEALFNGRHGPFIELRDELADSWARIGVRTVICDAYEHRILMHDVVNLVVGAAVDAMNDRGETITSVEFPIYLTESDERPGNPSLAASLELSEQLLQRKISAARGYESEVVRHEVEGFLAHHGQGHYRTEFLYRSIRRRADDLLNEPRPEWEVHGERMVKEGVYEHAIRLREHVVPLARALELRSQTDV